MVVTVARQTEYIPEWNSNKTDEKPIVIVHKAPTTVLSEMLIPKPVFKMKMGNDGNGSVSETEFTVDYKKIVKEMVIEIKNLTIDVDGKPLVITNVTDLFSPSTPSCINGLVDDVGLYLQTLLSAKEAKTKN